MKVGEKILFLASALTSILASTLRYWLGIYAYFFPFPVQTLERDDPVDLGKEGEIFSLAHVAARVNPGPVLPHQNRSGMDKLPAVTFDSEPLAGAVPAISGASLSFFMRHENLQTKVPKVRSAENVRNS
jgi:hypothetical protein